MIDITEELIKKIRIRCKYQMFEKQPFVTPEENIRQVLEALKEEEKNYKKINNNI